MKKIGKSKAEALVKAGAFLVDMRSPVAFRDGHVTGAVNLPLRNFVNRIMGMDKSKKIIIYGDSVDDADLKHGNTYAETLGFANVFVSDYKSLTEESNVKAFAKKEVEAKARRQGRKRNTQGAVLLRNHR